MFFKQKNGPDVYLQKMSYDDFREKTNQPTYWCNLTPHPITLVISETPPKTMYDTLNVICVVFPATGQVARVEFGLPQAQIIDGFRIHDTVPIKGIISLPEPKPNVMLLVSALVREQLRGSGRTDVFSPDTGTTALRNEKGGVFAVRALQRA